LQLGGSQVATIPVPPGAFVFTVAVPAVELATVEDAAVTAALPGESDIQSSVGIGLVSFFPSRSITVGVMKMPEVLLAIEKDVLVAAFPTCRLID
jgi:hypothetical protein